MRILCLNGWGGRLHDDLVAYLAEADPDVLCIQEVVDTPAARRPWLIYRDDGAELPQRARSFDDLRGALPDHAAFFCPAAEGALWDGDVPVPSQWGIATFVRRGIPVIGQAQGFVHGDFSSGGFGAHPRSRTAHAVRLFDTAANRALTVAHMHGLRDLAGKHDTPERLAQAARLARLVSGLAQEAEPLVVCGDFNVLPDSETFATLGALGLRDLVGTADTRTSWYTKPARHADYMLVNGAVEVLRFEIVVQPEVSDHRPLLIEIAPDPDAEKSFPAG